MSRETLAAVEAAISAHVADIVDDTMLTHFVVMTACITPTDDNDTATYVWFSADGTPLHVKMGLAQYLGAQLTQDLISDG